MTVWRDHRSQRGFTLVELLVTIVVLGVLSAIVVFSVRGVGDRGQQSAYRVDARTIEIAEEAHFAIFGSYVDEDALVGTFLSQPSTYHDVLATDEGKSYVILCAPDEDCGRPTRGGTMVVGLGEDPGSLNPAVTTNGAVHEASELMFNGLVGIDDRGEPYPELAQSWSLDPTNRVVTFRLRPGVVWHDDRSLTSADVKFTFEEALLKHHSRARASLKEALDSISTPDAHTVVFNLRYPYAPLLRQLNVTEAPMLPKHIYGVCADISTVKGCPANLAPVGTGPFKLAGYTADEEIRLVRNAKYFGSPWPLLDEVVQRFIPDTGDRTLALEEGEVDWVWGVPGPDQPLLREKGFTLVPASRGPGGANCLMTLGFNLTAKGDVRGQVGGPAPNATADPHPVLGDVRVRTAIAYALDREALFSTVHFRAGSVATAPISSGIPWAYAEGVALPAFDQGEAADLLDAAGWTRPPGEGTRTREDGTELKLDFVTPDEGDQYEYGELVEGQLEAVGIDVTHVDLEQDDYESTVFEERNFDTTIVSYCHGDDPEIGVRRQYDSSQISTTAFGNAAGYRNAEVDRLFADAAAEPSQVERRELYRQIQQIVAAGLPYVWMVETVNTRAHRSSCLGFNHQNTGLFAERAGCARPEP